ncbi:hypothetical protein niasHT_034585 [Heterodera trifolii]|uniref:Ras-GEF domain-containing protein n=1 Tax=Heterodera trifolii TaxID=157864 RepID=A0ABD2IPK2_9BILA
MRKERQLKGRQISVDERKATAANSTDGKTATAAVRSRSCQSAAKVKGESDRRWWLEPPELITTDYGHSSTAAEMTSERPSRHLLTLHAFMEKQLSARRPMAHCSNGVSPSFSSSPCSSSSIPGTIHSVKNDDEIEPTEESGKSNGISAKRTNARQMSQEELSVELAATLQRLFPTVDHCPSSQQIFVHLVNLRTFISPSELLQKLLQHTMFTQNARASNFAKASRRRLFNNVFFFCSEWVRSVPYDFRDQSMRDRLLALLALGGAAKDVQAQQRVDELFAELRTELVRLERYEQAIRSLEPGLEKDERKSDCLTGLVGLGEKAATVAQQLAHIELERLSMIGVDEMMAAICANSPNCLGEHPPRGTVRHYVAWFNQLSALVASEVLRHAHKRHRAKSVEFYIEVAKECVNCGNFNSLMAIVAGLSAQPVARLRRTWNRVDKSKLEVLQRQLDPSGNFVNYRATLKAAIWRADSDTDGTNRLVIPFFGLLLKDLLMLFRKCVQPLPSGHFNQMAFSEFADQISLVERWKRRPCPFSKCNAVLQHLLLCPIYSERSMFVLSYAYEMAENGAEREHFRKITAEN